MDIFIFTPGIKALYSKKRRVTQFVSANISQMKDVEPMDYAFLIA